MSFWLSTEELAVLYGSTHIQQLAYLRGIRPYMDIQTRIVGKKRKISYQSIAEQLYIEPHPGIKATSFSRAQIRRAIAGLERIGLVEVESEEYQLILKCPLATRHYSVQNKAVTNPSDYPVTVDNTQSRTSAGFSTVQHQRADTDDMTKAVIPHNSNNNYIFLLKHFEKFWALYPLKNSQSKAWQIFQELNPSDELIAQIVAALKNQIQFMQRQQSLGHWVPNWKNPANWLSQHCWNDVIPIEHHIKESQYAKNQINYTKQQSSDPLWNLCKPDNEEADASPSNVIEFSKRGR